MNAEANSEIETAIEFSDGGLVMNAEANSEIETAIEWCLTHAGRGLAAELAQDAARVLREKWATSTPGQCGPLAYVISTALHVGAETAIAWAEGQDRRLRREPPTAADPTPRERGQNTCRAALMTVIGLHRRENTLGPDMARAIVDATQALMDLDGLRASEAAALDVAKERDDARALAEGLTRGQDDLRRQMKAITGDRDLAVEDRDYARARMNKVLEQSAVLQATCNRLTEERDAARDVGDAFGRAAEVERDRLQLENGRLHRAMDEMQAAQQVEREAVWDRAMRIIGWCDEPPEEWAQATIDDVQVLERMLQRALDRKKSP